MNFNSLVLRSKSHLSHQFKFASYKFSTKDEGKPIVYFNLRKPHIYNRYLYTFIKFLHLEGFQIWFPNAFKIFKRINEADIYLKLVLREKLVNFKEPEGLDIFLELNEENLSPDYYTFLTKSLCPNSFIIPMGLHPSFYNQKLWSENPTSFPKKKSIFMSGNFEVSSYRTIENSHFKVKSRIEIFEFLQEKNLLKELESQKALANFIDGKEDYKCLIVRRENYSIPMNELREVLSRFHFYLACPGVVIPNSHNLIEAMSVGCIPLIQENYALTMVPQLVDMENAIIFKDFSSLPSKIKNCYNLSDDIIDQMQKNVLEYYQLHLTPTGVIKKIKDNKYDKFYLQAEFESAKLFRYNMILKDLEN